MDSLYLAWRYLLAHRGRSAVVIVAAALIIATPIAIQALTQAADRQLRARADATPLVVGALGGDVELVLHTLYFTGSGPRDIGYGALDAANDVPGVTGIPVHARYSAAGAPVVGTSRRVLRLSSAPRRER